MIFQTTAATSSKDKKQLQLQKKKIRIVTCEKLMFLGYQRQQKGILAWKNKPPKLGKTKLYQNYKESTIHSQKQMHITCAGFLLKMLSLFPLAWDKLQYNHPPTHNSLNKFALRVPHLVDGKGGSSITKKKSYQFIFLSLCKF